VNASGAQLQVSVMTSRDCTWNMSGGASWVQLSPRTGQGESAVTLVVAANPSTSSRTTTIIVNDRSINIVQDAATPPPPPPGPGPAPNPNPSPEPPSAPQFVARIDLNGRIGSVMGSCPSLSFSLSERLVVTNPQTRFSGGNCRDVRNGLDVELTGDLYSDGIVRATRIELDD
jgi:hypothetical protein